MKLPYNSAIDKHIDFENLNFIPDDYPLVDIQCGDKLLIYWFGEEDFPDIGYAMGLPDVDYKKEGNVIIHIPNPHNFGGIDDTSEVYIHLLDLFYSEDVIKIVKVED